MSSHPPPPPPPSQLPPDWAEHRDAGGRVYFHNARTNETTWYRPLPPSVGSPPPPPPPPPPEAPGYRYGSATIAASQISGTGGYKPSSVIHRASTQTERHEGERADYPPHTGQMSPYDTDYMPGAPPSGYPPSGPRPTQPPPGGFPPPPGIGKHHGYPLHVSQAPYHHQNPPPPVPPSRPAYGPHYQPSLQGGPYGGRPPTHIAHGGHVPSYGGPHYGPPRPEAHHQASGVSSYGYGVGPANYVGRDDTSASDGDAKAGGSEVQLEFSASGLKKKDLIGKSDPMLVAYMEIKDRNGEKRWREIGRTETIMNNHNPRWSKRVTLSYRFYELQRLRLAIFDVDTKHAHLSSNDVLGIVETDLGHIMTCGTFKSGLKKMRFVRGIPVPVTTSSDRNGNVNLGDLIIRVHNASVEGQSKVCMMVSANGLDRKDGLLGKSDPYFIVNQLMSTTSASNVSTKSDEDYSVLYKSEKIMNNLNPIWKPAEFILNTQGQPWHKVQLRFDCYDWDRYTPHDLIGRGTTTLAHLSSGSSTTIELINESKKRKKGKRYTDSGKMTISNYRLLQFPSFNSYIQAGLKIHLTVGIDFTASNGGPSDPQSLHYIGINSNSDPTQLPNNQYIQALKSVGEILSVYTRNGAIAAYGFGAKCPPDLSRTSFQFPLNSNGQPYCYGVEGLIEAYKERVFNIEFSGPTNFAPLIKTTREIALNQPLSIRNLTYHCLLILTDGAITDMIETVNTIIECSYIIPMSIIIIGIGNADFSKMKRLDADDCILTSDDGQRKAKRDIVQFVPFRKYINNPYKDGLSAEVLAELPSRIVETMVDAGIMPEHVAPLY